MLQRATLPRLRQALQSGSNGILVDALIAEGYILTALRTVLAGDTYLDPSLGVLLERSESSYDSQLNERQLAITALVMEGCRERKIGAQISIAFDTVRLHLKQVIN